MSKTQKKDKKIKKNTLPFRFFAGIVKIFYKKRKVEGLENLPEDPCIIVANHSQIHGPLTFELRVKFPRLIWCDSAMMETKEVPNYAEKAFWPDATDKVKKSRRRLMKSIGWFVAYIFNRAHTLPVYRDMRLMKTFKMTEEALAKGNHIVIFPENEFGFNGILDEFNLHFCDIAKIYYKKKGVCLKFVPVYNCVDLKRVVVSRKHFTYDPSIPIEEQRKILCDGIREEITRLAKELPRHKVIPFMPTDEEIYSKDE